MGGEGIAAKGTIDVAHGLNLTDSKSAADGKEGIDLATNPANALALPLTSPQMALQIGSLVDAAMGAQDLATLPTSIPTAINKGASAWSVKEFVNQVVTNVKNWISPVSVQ